MNENKKTVSDNVNHPVIGENLRIQICKESIAQTINKAQLPPGTLLMIMNEFVQQMQVQNIKAIEAERKAFDQSQKEGVDNGKEIRKD